ncbi:MAG: DNA gyrase subunit B, partial [Geminicoccaceae bacterium]|nr:DNA gyrase subunit B [Geminicoccaceae bacterium]
DGSHIRTLLLTFFYRHLPQIVEGGYLYIAQPPLYRVKRGQKERYLKDDAALENYLVDTGLEDCALEVAANGAEARLIQSEELAALVAEARVARSMVQSLARRHPLELVETLALVGGFAEGALSDETDALRLGQQVARRLSERKLGGWQVHLSDEAELIFHHQLGERRVRHRLEPALARSPEAKRLAAALGGMSDLFDRSTFLVRKEQRTRVDGPVGLVESVLQFGRKGLSIQRYKGLGEMNPGQLWETTLDPEVRSLVKVGVEHTDQAADIFATLMGDVVEPRREFIQDNALKVVNLDI